MKIDIIKHPNETDGKSTAVHAKLLAPNDVSLYKYPCIPDYDKDKVSRWSVTPRGVFGKVFSCMLLVTNTFYPVLLVILTSKTASTEMQ